MEVENAPAAMASAGSSAPTAATSGGALPMETGTKRGAEEDVELHIFVQALHRLGCDAADTAELVKDTLHGSMCLLVMGEPQSTTSDRLALTGGRVFDLCRADPDDGQPWDISNLAKQRKAE